uniref:Potassium/proton antiporter CemA n=1 Tax=Gracilaria tenuistipitata var. liui TaxID=285951 RepID=CEMA_GRATL|nr:envelope membrane protein [Gracilaria tenuistipitata var. liui]Q6B8P8.1 RecName: Full=Potassium/proton antiporter CemA; AltName: Full=Chloroplast envelope membrane protein A; Short=CemA [Gracilaria tenuistipitata var. liui]AAT79737.1 heme binding protein cemA [Gracilaria tenuistipitata var. liui]
MKYWNLKKINQSSLDKTGVIPRSISKLFEKFKKELDPNAEVEAIEEFKVARYQTIASVKYVVFLFIIPVLINQVSKSFLFGPFINYLWNRDEHIIFLNHSQEERAFAELQRFEEKLHFEILIGKIDSPSSNLINYKMTEKALELAIDYANESSCAITNILADLLSIAIFISILISSKRQFSILKSFLNELIYSLSDTAKAFLIILFTDMFVGFHSPHGWEVIIEIILRHLGLPESRDFIFVFISTFPVILDTIFKYWIFRYLNKISPSAVATYHNMNE